MNNRFRVELVGAQSMTTGNRNNLGLVTVDLIAPGFSLRFFSLHLRRHADGSPFVMIPGRAAVRADGQPIRGDDGMLQYRRIVALKDPDMRAFSDATIEELRNERPDLIP